MLGLGNLRTGYWWDSAVSDRRRSPPIAMSWSQRFWNAIPSLFVTQYLIICEYIARFGGPWFRYWYLSDGGYFDNLGLYELIRRHTPFIVCCDVGADPNYHLEDLGNAVCKARADFEVEIEFYTADEIAGLAGVPNGVRTHLGGLADLVPGRKSKTSRKHAALAKISYPGVGTLPGTLLYVKSSVTGDESADVCEYKSRNPDFPHEPTSDQIFRERQWESYRKLGEHVMKAFAVPGNAGPFWLFEVVHP